MWKTLGLAFRDAAGELLLPDDERLAPVFAAAGELGLPVMIHTADPVAFFGRSTRATSASRSSSPTPSGRSSARACRPTPRLMDSFEALVSAHPGTTFIGAHVAGNAEDLGWVSRALDEHPNLYVDFAARISDLGRQPRAARRLFCEHPDRILFGTDDPPVRADALRRYFHFLEASDECFAYSDQSPPPAGRWTISALELPDRGPEGDLR